MIIYSQNKQQGVTLVFSLVILVTLTLIGVSSIQGTRTELAMAGNQRESNLMFQAAEMGLRAAEANIVASNTNGDFANPALGLTTVAPQAAGYNPNYFATATWAATTSQEAGTGTYSSAKPRYIIEYLGDRTQNPLAASVNIGSYGGGQAGDTVSIYRSTARGVGLTGNSFRYVQSYFGKLAP
jgi:type IV pilus assembly protein PilX